MINVLPTEILLKIFKYIDPKKLSKCRPVSLRWKNIIDELLNNDDIWYRVCKDDFPSIFKIAKHNAIQDTSWHNVYKSLHLWSKLQKAHENITELKLDCLKEKEIRDFKVLRNGIIGIHSELSIVFLDLDTMECSNVYPSIQGNYVRYNENDHLIVLMNPFMHLFIIIVGDERYLEENQFCADDVIMFLLVDKCVYYITKDDKLYVYNLELNNFDACYIHTFSEGVVTLGFSDQLNILTHGQRVYSLLGNNRINCCELESASHLLHDLWKYNLLEQMDWQVYMQWMYEINNIIPYNCIGLSVVRQYGDIVFVGKSFGILDIYYRPFFNGEFDIWKSKPIKSYNLAGINDCEDTAVAQILHVEVIEMENGHIVIVALPSKIVRIDFLHDFERSEPN